MVAQSPERELVEGAPSTTSAEKSSRQRPAGIAALLDAKRYIVGPLYDWWLFLGPPTLAVVLGFIVSETPAAHEEIDFHGYEQSISALLLGIFIHAHLFAVFFRSHGNGTIRKLYPGRFLLAPVLLFTGMMLNDVFMVSISVLATFWDVYHSGAQTFGFARLYDMKAGNDPLVGRKLDFWLNQLLYAGPIIGGATMLDHFEDFNEFKAVDLDFFEKVPAFMTAEQGYFTWSILIVGGLFLVYYLYAQWRFTKQGYTVSPQKVFLLVTTGACSIVVWGFNTWGEAFLIMNAFHALQYFGLVWAKERPTMQKMLGMDGQGAWKRALTWVVFIALTLGYGYWAEAADSDVRAFVAITLVVSIMHFWYDGFVWSVRKKQV